MTVPATIPPEPGVWSPCTFVPASTTCRCCWSPIPRSKPPGPSETRVRAYFNATLNDWECNGCRAEADRVAAWRAGPSRGAPTGTGGGGAPAVTAPEFGLTNTIFTTEAA